MIKAPLRSSDGGLIAPSPPGEGTWQPIAIDTLTIPTRGRSTARYWTRGTALARSYFTMARSLFSICM